MVSWEHPQKKAAVPQANAEGHVKRRWRNGHRLGGEKTDESSVEGWEEWWAVANIPS